MVSRSVMDMAGIVPEKDLQEEGEEGVAAEVESSEERLSVFEDFLEGLDIEPDKDDDEDDDKD
jgi:hypothetical protein